MAGYRDDPGARYLDARVRRSPGRERCDDGVRVARLSRGAGYRLDGTGDNRFVVQDVAVRHCYNQHIKRHRCVQR